LLCVFVPPPTFLIKVVDLGSIHWALPLFKYFCSISGLSHSCCRWPEWNCIICSKHSPDFIRWGFTRALKNLWEPEVPHAINHVTPWRPVYEYIVPGNQPKPALSVALPMPQLLRHLR